MVCRFFRVAAAFATAFAMVTAPMAAHAVGYWNVPGNVCQCWGYGWGAGHHACLTLGPITNEGCFAHNEVRLPCAPQPPYACYSDPGYNFDFRQRAHAVTYEQSTAPVEYEPNQPQLQQLPQAQPLPQQHQGESPPLGVPELAPDSLPMPDETLPDMPEPKRALFDPPVEP
jgi:hypothetical protein